MNLREIITQIFQKQILERLGLYEHFWLSTRRQCIKSDCDMFSFFEEGGDKLSFTENIGIRTLNNNDNKLIITLLETEFYKIKQSEIPYIFHLDYSSPETVTFVTSNFNTFRKHCDY